MQNTHVDKTFHDIFFFFALVFFSLKISCIIFYSAITVMFFQSDFVKRMLLSLRDTIKRDSAFYLVSRNIQNCVFFLSLCISYMVTLLLVTEKIFLIESSLSFKGNATHWSVFKDSFFHSLILYMKISN